MQIYVVSPGDTVDTIASAFQVPVASIIFDNQLVYPYQLAVGQSLLLQDGAPPQRLRSVSVNGYAYPFISPWVLQETLPYLTDLSIFSYGFTSDGNLVPPLLSEEWMLDAAEAARTRPVLVLTPLGPDGRFNNELISSLVNNFTVQEQLLNQLIETMETLGYGGLDIDFEYIKAEDRDAFTEFVSRTVDTLSPLGYPVSVALAPKTSADQQGLLYQGKDYPALGAIADHVLLMTYEWGYTYGPPMAVAPLSMVRRVVDYAVTEIAPGKIDLGIPNYGYDWPLPFVRGETAATTIGNVEAVRLAVRYNAVIQFDETAQSPYFYYENEGITHEVWFEDARSIRAKLGLIQEYGLRGAGYWQIMQWWRANWLLMDDMYTINKRSGGT
ncbi:glycosyl hydrolase family 18 protein [Ruminococcus gauvreauii]|uniref:Glycosyl hydrolase family 18 protein n=1 Tax=Ruminococcus gauvreauii TaxID=438033 RepID=A0ABY5VIE2_9FIRM|nr:glycosyl hydrolase family 18 protein [Ruminococcus gauvreauii]UWP60344.1 glycosyl hydrolase family 18 protein [Ruminococcus gauvreauii]